MKIPVTTEAGARLTRPEVGMGPEFRSRRERDVLPAEVTRCFRLRSRVLRQRDSAAAQRHDQRLELAAVLTPAAG